MWPQKETRVTQFLHVVSVLNEFQGTFMSPSWCLYCNNCAEMQSSVVPNKGRNSLIGGWEESECNSVAQQRSATECLKMWRLRSAFRCPWVSVEPPVFVLCVELSPTCCRASERSAFQFSTFWWWELQFSIALALFEALVGEPFGS